MAKEIKIILSASGNGHAEHGQTIIFSKFPIDSLNFIFFVVLSQFWILRSKFGFTCSKGPWSRPWEEAVGRLYCEKVGN